MPRSYPIRSTRNSNINYAEYDLSYAAEAEYDSDYIPPSAEEFRQAARATRSAPTNSADTSSAAAPVTRTTSVRRSPRNRDNTSRTSTISNRSSTSQ